MRNNQIVHGGYRSFLRNFGGMWRGAGLTVARDSLGCASFFVTLDLAKQHLPESINSPLTHGMCAGLGFWTVALPFDTVKTLQQTSEKGGDTQARWMQRLVSKPTLVWRGWLVAVMRGLPGAGITVWSYTAALDWIQNR